MSKVRIVSDGTASGTKVFTRQGLLDVVLDGVVKIEFMPIESARLPQVRITFEAPDIDVLAEKLDAGVEP